VLVDEANKVLIGGDGGSGAGNAATDNCNEKRQRGGKQ
jgi:hypothetical protein